MTYLDSKYQILLPALMVRDEYTITIIRTELRYVVVEDWSNVEFGDYNYALYHLEQYVAGNPLIDPDYNNIAIAILVERVMYERFIATQIRFGADIAVCNL